MLSHQYPSFAHKRPILFAIRNNDFRHCTIIIDSHAALRPHVIFLPLLLTPRQRQTSHVLLLTQELSRRDIETPPVVVQVCFHIRFFDIPANPCGFLHPLHPIT